MKELDNATEVTQRDVISHIFAPLFTAHGKAIFNPQKPQGQAFAPTNIALCKYWGKRNQTLNLPMTNSLSVALPTLGANTTITPLYGAHDLITLNQTDIKLDSAFAQRLITFVDLFRVPRKQFFHFDITMNIPVAAGLASSAAGFASITLALDDLFAWNLPKQVLSVLARLGSGSAARSIWNGFVEWQSGARPDGMDSHGVPLDVTWPHLYIGILPISQYEKPISSRVAMQRTVDSSMFYSVWPKKVAHDLPLLKMAIEKKHFPLLAGTAESNSLNMHATMLSSWPPICYFYPGTIAAMQRVWTLREEGLELYFTQDAGPNLKLIFESENVEIVREHFPDVECVRLF